MGTLTITIKDQTERTFRELVKSCYGQGRGKLGSAVGEALNYWVQKKQSEDIAQRELRLLRKGFQLGKWTGNREELYERS